MRNEAAQKSKRPSRRAHQAAPVASGNTLRLAAHSWSRPAGPFERTHPPLLAPLSSPLEATPPQSCGQVYNFTVSNDGTSWDARVHDALVNALLRPRLDHFRDVRLDLGAPNMPLNTKSTISLLTAGKRDVLLRFQNSSLNELQVVRTGQLPRFPTKSAALSPLRRWRGCGGLLSTANLFASRSCRFTSADNVPSSGGSSLPPLLSRATSDMMSPVRMTPLNQNTGTIIVIVIVIVAPDK